MPPVRRRPRGGLAGRSRRAVGEEPADQRVRDGGAVPFLQRAQGGAAMSTPETAGEEPRVQAARVTIDPATARRGQLGAHEAVLAALGAWRAGQRPRAECSVILPPGYGKSHLVRWIAASAWGAGLAASTLVLSPADYLRGQLVAEDKVGDFLRRFRVRTAAGSPLKYDAIRTPGV